MWKQYTPHIVLIQFVGDIKTVYTVDSRYLDLAYLE